MSAYQLENQPAYDIPLSDDELRLIGLICAVWAQIEGQVDRIIARLAQLPDLDTMRILLDRRDMRTKIDKAKDLAEKSANPTIWNALRPIYQTLLKYIAKRNDAVHGLWLGGIWGIPPQAVMEYKSRQLPASELAQIADNLAIVSCHLCHLQWCHGYGFAPEQSPWRDRLGSLDFQ